MARTLPHLYLAFFCLLIASVVGAAGAERRILRYHTTINEDGSVSTRTFSELFPQYLAQARTLSTAIIAVTGGGRFELLEAYTRKNNGSIVPAAPAQTASTPDAHIVKFRNLEALDSRVLEYKVNSGSAILPGVISRLLTLESAGIDYDAEYILDAPEGFPVLHSHRMFDYQETRSNGRVLRSWSAKTSRPQTSEGGLVDQLGHMPYIAFSNIPSYEKLGAIYFDNVLKRTEFSPVLKMIGEYLSKDGAGAFGKVERINMILSDKIQIIPSRSPEAFYQRPEPKATLEKGSGDAKEIVAVTAALLRAIGIESEFVLINAQRSAQLPEAPILQAFNHLLLYVPALGFYLDPSDRIVTFGKLAPQYMDSPIIRMSERGVVVTRTPVGAPDDDVVDVETKLNIDASGRRESETAISAKGRFAIQMRHFVAEAAGRGQDAVLRPIAERLGYRGRYTLDSPPAGDRREPFVVKIKSVEEGAMPLPRSGWRIPHALAPISPQISAFFGAARLSPRHYPAACNPGSIRQMVRVQFPPDVTLEEVPEPLDFTYGDFHGRREWTFRDSELSVLTTMSFAPASRICSQELLSGLQAALDQADDDINPLLRLKGSVVAPLRSTTGPLSVSPP